MESIPVTSPRKPLRICLVNSYDWSPEGGGVKQHIIHLANALRQLGDHVTIIAPCSKVIDNKICQGFFGVIKITGNGSENRLGLMISPWQIWRFFQKNQFDVIHLHEAQNPLLSHYVVWFTKHLPHVATFHAYCEQEDGLWLRKLSGSTIFPWIHKAIAVSEAAASYARGSWSKDLTIIPNGIDSSLFQPADDLVLEEKSKTAPKLSLLFVGRLADKRKGAQCLIEAYQRLKELNMAVTLDMVGDKDRLVLPDIEDLTYHGEVSLEHLLKLYQQKDVAVFPSTGQESFGIVLLEAMAAAKPLVCSDIKGYKAVANPKGTLFFKKNNSRDLQAQLEKMIFMPVALRTKMAQSNRRYALAYDWQLLVQQIRQVYLLAIQDKHIAKDNHRQQPLQSTKKDTQTFQLSV